MERLLTLAGAFGLSLIVAFVAAWRLVEHFWYGVSAAGKLYRCLDHNGWRWVPV